MYSKVIQLYIHIYFFRFFSLIGYYKILSRVPCTGLNQEHGIGWVSQARGQDPHLLNLTDTGLAKAMVKKSFTAHNPTPSCRIQMLKSWSDQKRQSLKKVASELGTPCSYHLQLESRKHMACVLGDTGDSCLTYAWKIYTDTRLIEWAHGNYILTIRESPEQSEDLC